MRPCIRGFCLVFFLFFSLQPGCAPDPVPVAPVVAPIQYPDWIYRRDAVWIEVQDGKIITWVGGSCSMLYPADDSKLETVRTTTIALAQRQAIVTARNRVYLTKFLVEFDDPVTVVTSDSVLAFVRMRVD